MAAIGGAASDFCAAVRAGGRGEFEEIWKRHVEVYMSPKNVVAHGEIEMTVPWRLFIGHRLCTHGSPKIPAAVVRYKLNPVSKCTVQMFPTGSIAVKGSRSVEEGLVAVHMLRKDVSDMDGAHVGLSNFRMTNSVYNYVSDLRLDLRPVLKYNADRVCFDKKFPGVRMTEPHTNIKFRAFSNGSRVLMGVRRPSSIGIAKLYIDRIFLTSAIKRFTSSAHSDDESACENAVDAQHPVDAKTRAFLETSLRVVNARIAVLERHARASRIRDACPAVTLYAPPQGSHI